MSFKHVMVNLDEEIHQIATYKLSNSGSNISEFCRFCLESFVFDGIELPNPAKIAAERITKEVIQNMQAQKKILQGEELAQAEAEEYARKRKEKVDRAAKAVLLRYPLFVKALPENDQFGDYADTLDLILGEISEKSGHDVDLPEIRCIWQNMGAES